MKLLVPIAIMILAAFLLRPDISSAGAEASRFLGKDSARTSSIDLDSRTMDRDRAVDAALIDTRTGEYDMPEARDVAPGANTDAMDRLWLVLTNIEEALRDGDVRKLERLLINLRTRLPGDDEFARMLLVALESRLLTTGAEKEVIELLFAGASESVVEELKSVFAARERQIADEYPRDIATVVAQLEDMTRPLTLLSMLRRMPRAVAADPEVIGALGRLLQYTDDAEIRGQILYRLQEAGDAAMPLLLDEIERPMHPESRNAAIRALGSMQGEEGGRTLLRIAQDPLEETVARRHAVQGLAGYAELDGVTETLVATFWEDQDPEARKGALQALQSHVSTADLALRAMLDVLERASEQEFRMSGARALLSARVDPELAQRIDSIRVNEPEDTKLRRLLDLAYARWTKAM